MSIIRLFDTMPVIFHISALRPYLMESSSFLKCFYFMLRAPACSEQLSPVERSRSATAKPRYLKQETCYTQLYPKNHDILLASRHQTYPAMLEFIVFRTPVAAVLYCHPGLNKSLTGKLFTISRRIVSREL